MQQLRARVAMLRVSCCCALCTACRAQDSKTLLPNCVHEAPGLHAHHALLHAAGPAGLQQRRRAPRLLRPFRRRGRQAAHLLE